jgi:uncharacterized SAM-binding protein YcdF (DUF218 family)
MFLFKKIVTISLLPPGIIIVLLILAVLFLKKRFRLFMVGLVVIIFVVSIAPTKDLLLAPLENAYRIPPIEQIKKADVYVLLGGGAEESAPDLYGKGVVSGDGLIRLLTVYRLYRMERKPIIASGGSVFNRGSESEIARKILIQLGAKPEDIIVETKSRDTFENAQCTAEIAAKRGMKRIVLVTSAFHMKRSVLLFKRHFIDITPFPAGYYTSQQPYDPMHYFPSADSMAQFCAALKEYMGLFFYTYLR